MTTHLERLKAELKETRKARKAAYLAESRVECGDCFAFLSADPTCSSYCPACIHSSSKVNQADAFYKLDQRCLELEREIRATETLGTFCAD